MSTAYFVILFVLILIFFIEIYFSFNPLSYIENFDPFKEAQAKGRAKAHAKAKAKAKAKAQAKAQAKEKAQAKAIGFGRNEVKKPKPKNDCNSGQQKIAKNQQGRIDELGNKLNRLELELKSQQKMLSTSKELNVMNKLKLKESKEAIKKSKDEEKKRQEKKD